MSSRIGNQCWAAFNTIASHCVPEKKGQARGVGGFLRGHTYQEGLCCMYALGSPP